MTEKYKPAKKLRSDSQCMLVVPKIRPKRYCRHTILVERFVHC